MEIIIALIEMDEDLKEQVIADMGKWSLKPGFSDSFQMKVGSGASLLSKIKHTPMKDWDNLPKVTDVSLIIQQKIP